MKEPTNGEGLTQAEWFAATGFTGRDIYTNLGADWLRGVDPTEHRAMPERRDMIARIARRTANMKDAESWLFDEVYPKVGWEIATIDGVWCVLCPKRWVSGA